MTIKELANVIAAEFNKAVIEAECKNFKEMRSLYDWDASDIRAEIDSMVTDLLNKDYDEYVESNGSYEGYTGISIYDDGSLYDMKNNEEMTYGQFKKLVFANVK